VNSVRLSAGCARRFPRARHLIIRIDFTSVLLCWASALFACCVVRVAVAVHEDEREAAWLAGLDRRVEAAKARGGTAAEWTKARGRIFQGTRWRVRLLRILPEAAEVPAEAAGVVRAGGPDWDMLLKSDTSDGRIDLA
jgi:hypothetical protein